MRVPLWMILFTFALVLAIGVMVLIIRRLSKDIEHARRSCREELEQMRRESEYELSELKKKADEEMKRTKDDMSRFVTETAKRIILLDDRLKKTYDIGYLLRIVGRPTSDTLGKDRLPMNIDATGLPWGEKYTFFGKPLLSPGIRQHTTTYHKPTCRHSTTGSPINAFSIISDLKHYKPCAVCKPQLPDTSWVRTYRILSEFIESYTREKKVNTELRVPVSKVSNVDPELSVWETIEFSPLADKTPEEDSLMREIDELRLENDRLVHENSTLRDERDKALIDADNARRYSAAKDIKKQEADALEVKAVLDTFMEQFRRHDACVIGVPTDAVISRAYKGIMMDPRLISYVTVEAKVKSSSANESYLTSLTSCNCEDWKRHLRPCKHMYALAGYFNLLSCRDDWELEDRISELNEKIAELKDAKKALRHGNAPN